ncbi:MAG TPA: FAD-dependent oxidoreductase [Burkholderiales bacterium]|nr:FAD-dependent oxidoreductase [Burkholderiales bacterium]
MTRSAMAEYDPLVARSPGTGLPHSPSYWTATIDREPADDGPAPAASQTDVAIIGGGYTGLACAYFLARDYGVRPVVLEANRSGWGCSGRNGGFARAAIGRHTWGKVIDIWGRETARTMFRQALSAVDTVRELIAAGAGCDAIEPGHLKIAHRPSRAAGLRAEAELLQREFQYPATFMTAAESREHIGGTQSHGALRVPDALAVHPLKLALGVHRLARDAGAIVRTASPVLAWTKNGRDHRLQTPAGMVSARRVVIATNGYTPEHLHDCVRRTTLPVLSHIIVTRPMTASEKQASGFVTDHVLTDSRNLLYYWRRLPDDRILFGGRGMVHPVPSQFGSQREFLLAELKAKLPALRDITVDYDWWGWVCLTRDLMPHVYHAGDDATVHYAIGYQGSGVAYGLHAGRMLARRLANDGDSAPIPATSTPLPRIPFAVMRRTVQRAAYTWYRYLDNRD